MNTLNEEKSETTLLTINGTIEELIISIENNLPGMNNKLYEFIEIFNREFPSDNPEDRGRAEAITWALMGAPLILYSLGMNGAAIIELHGIVERLALRETVNNIASISKKSIVTDVMERCTLSDFTSILFDLEILDKDDLKFSKKLSRIRNGLAHKNPEIISNVAYSGKKISFLDIDSVINNFDCIPFIIESIRLLVKMSKIEDSNNSNQKSTNKPEY